MVRRFDIKRIHSGVVDRDLDTIAIEEPLVIHVAHWRKQVRVTENLAVTMRTPGADVELAVGLLVTEGVIHNRADVIEARPLGGGEGNEVLVELAPGVDFDAWRQQRSGFISSSCGVCGKANIDLIQQTTPALETSTWRISPAFIHGLPALVHDHQPTFNQTGGVHAAAVISLGGKLESLFEDVGRHNALDKVIGRALLNHQLPLTNHVLFMSSRSSFELIQKAATAGIPALASVGSPSSLAIETARKLLLTLICFVRDERFNVYSGDWRLDLK